MTKRFVWPLLFLAVPAWILMVAPATRAPSDAPHAAGWLIAPISASAVAAQLKKGERIFSRDCARCHGQAGDGVSPNAETLRPRPFDLNSFELADSFIVRVVRGGVPGSDMPGWRLGTDEEVHAVAAYTAGLSRPDALLPQDRYAAPEALQEGGKRVYATHCATCHGERGNGDGADAGRYLPRPASFADMRPSYAAARRVIEDGVHGTAMASWPLLNEPEIQAVTFYVRSLYTRTGRAGVHP